MFEINLVPDIKREYLRKRRIRTLITFICVLVVLGSVGIVALMGLTVGTQALTDNLADGNIDSKYEALVGHIDGNIEQSTLNKSDTEQVLTLQRQLQGLSSQATEKTMPSRIFAVLDTILPPNFVIGISEIRFDVDSNTLSIDGQAGTEGVDGQEQNGSQALAAFEETIKRTNYSYCTQDCGNIDSWTEDERKNNMTEPIPLIVPDIPLSQSDVSFGRSFDGGLTLRFTVTFQLDVGVLAYSNQGMRIIAPNKQNVTDSYVQIRDDIFTERVEDETSNETTPSSPPTTNTTTPIGEQ